MSELNSQQLQAVTQIYGPVLLVAGPGTGKTQTLALRIKKILELTDTNPSNILCITYTDAGVTAMRERLKKHIGEVAYKVGIYTFHGFCNEIIQKYSELFPRFTAKPTQVSGLAQFKVLQQVLDSLPTGVLYDLKPIGQPYKNLYTIGSRISTLKQEGILPQEFSEQVNAEYLELQNNPVAGKGANGLNGEYSTKLDRTKKLLEFAKVYQLYQEYLFDHNMFDYNDMINEVLQVLQTNQNLVFDLQEQYQYLLIDEYQDTNGAQNKIIKLLTQEVEQPNVFAVGDDDQAIFKFQGASVYHMFNFKQEFESAITIPLTINYRSTQAILNLAMDSIGHNSERLVNLDPQLNKSLTSAGGQDGQLPAVHKFVSGEQEIEYLVKEVKQLIASGKNPSEIAIIYAQHKDSEDLIDELLKNQVPINVKAGSNALNELPVVQLLQLLQVLLQAPNDRNYLLGKVLLHPYWNINQVDVFKIVRYASDVNYKNKFASTQLLDVLQTATTLSELNLQQPQQLENVANMLIQFYSMQQSLGLYALVLTIMQDSGMLNLIKQGYYTIEQVNALNSIIDFIKQEQQLNPGVSLQDLFTDLGTAKEHNIKILEQDLKTGKEGVNLLTAHSAKGLEFDHVYIYKCINKKWGNKTDSSILKLPGWVFGLERTKEEIKDAANQENRRLFFVAATRAKQNLTITLATSYADTATEASESIFISELDSNLFNLVQHQAPQNSLNDLVNKLTLASKLQLNESDFLLQQLQDFKLSASSLNEYIKCPLNFKYNYLYKFPGLPSTDAALGTAIHAALQVWGELLMQGKEVNLNYLIATARTALEKELLSFDQLADLTIKSQELLEQYFVAKSQSFQVPEQVEYNFSRHMVMLPIGNEEPIQLTGKIDKVEMVDANNLEVRLVDYKTGASKTYNEIMGTTAKADKTIFRQLAFYCLMCQLDPNFKPKNNFKNYKVVGTRVDFLKSKTGKFDSTEIIINDADLSELKQEIISAVTSMRNLEFGSKCGECESCLALKQSLTVSGA